MASDAKKRARQMAWDIEPSETPNQTGLIIARLIKDWNNKPRPKKDNGMAKLLAALDHK